MVERTLSMREAQGSIPCSSTFVFSTTCEKTYVSKTACKRSENGFDHINRNAPVLIRTPKLTRFEPAQYWGGGPPGNSVVLNPFFAISEVFFS